MDAVLNFNDSFAIDIFFGLNSKAILSSFSKGNEPLPTSTSELTSEIAKSLIFFLVKSDKTFSPFFFNDFQDVVKSKLVKLFFEGPSSTKDLSASFKKDIVHLSHLTARAIGLFFNLEIIFFFPIINPA